jgi:hypothetical protein
MYEHGLAYYGPQYGWLPPPPPVGPPVRTDMAYYGPQYGWLPPPPPPGPYPMHFGVGYGPPPPPPGYGGGSQAGISRVRQAIGQLRSAVEATSRGGQVSSLGNLQAAFDNLRNAMKAAWPTGGPHGPIG